MVCLSIGGCGVVSVQVQPVLKSRQYYGSIFGLSVASERYEVHQEVLLLMAAIG